MLRGVPPRKPDLESYVEAVAKRRRDAARGHRVLRRVVGKMLNDRTVDSVWAWRNAMRNAAQVRGTLLRVVKRLRGGGYAVAQTPAALALSSVVERMFAMLFAVCGPGGGLDGSVPLRCLTASYTATLSRWIGAYACSDGAPAPRDERSSKNYSCLNGPLFPSEPGYHQAASTAGR